MKKQMPIPYLIDSPVYKPINRKIVSKNMRGKRIKITKNTHKTPGVFPVILLGGVHHAEPVFI
ncbi:MAG: hypothetical protein Q8O92_03955 [Candidatus Latescibacter sp.]|nr:hypothetical protein [Candidatus Latescibacter sp.]